MRAFVRPPIGEALPGDVAEQFVGALGVVDAHARTVRVAEIELGMQMVTVDGARNMRLIDKGRSR